VETTPAPQAAPNFVHLQSDEGDDVGQGRTYAYTSGNADIAVSVTAGRLAVRVGGSEAWSGEFQLQGAQGKLQPGYHGKALRDATQTGLSWSGEGRSCSAALGWFTVDQATYQTTDHGTDLASLDLRFEQHCEGGTPALHGQIHWAAGT
jgi:hypothetical protein